MRQFLLSLQFLTILPVKIDGFVSEKEIAQSAAFFPVVGAFQGMLALLSTMVFLSIFPPDITAALTILVLILSNGGFHLDGLADTFDAIAVSSTGDESDKEKRLSVMKDSTTGAIGVIAIIFSILFKYLLLKELLAGPGLKPRPTAFFTTLFLMPVVSKWAMTVAMFHGRPARNEGLGRIFINGIRFRELLTSSLILLFIYAVTILFSADSIGLYVFATLILYLCSILWLFFCNKKFGGSTGDTLGALNEITEILFLFMVIIWQRLSI
ncbi:MAG: adenosylcobinamide-GDP ribazoletransferase [Thermodesulfovibrionales bacterium]